MDVQVSTKIQAEFLRFQWSFQFIYFILFYFILFYFILISFHFISFHLFIYFPKESLTCLRKGFTCWAGLQLQGQRPLLAVEVLDLQTLLFLPMQVSKEITLDEYQ